MTHPNFRRPILATLITAVALAAGAAPALASLPAPGCPTTPVSQPFSPWQDGADYFLAPGGDIEDGASSWTLTGGAAAVEGNESFQVGSPADHTSLSLPAGSAATTSTLCIGVEHPTMRLFARDTDGERHGSLLIEAVFDRDASEKAVKIARIEAGADWAPTAPVALIVNELAPDFGNALPVRLRFRPRGGSSWAIDDVYIDPTRTG